MLRLLVVLFSCHMVLCQQIVADLGPDNCKPDEVLQCLSCPGEVTCRNRDVAPVCSDLAQECVSKCVCKEGLFRADDGSCYNKEQCNKSLCPDENEFYDVGFYCDNVCGGGDQNRTNCPYTENIKPRPRCYCKDGFARDMNGNCVSAEECELDLERRRNRDPNLPPCCKPMYGFPLDFENN